MLPNVLSLRKRDIREVYQVRKILEVGIVEMAAINATVSQLGPMELALNDLIEAKTLKGWKADYEFHQAIAEACGNEILIESLKAVSESMKKGMMDCHRIILSDSKLSSDVSMQHTAIYEAIRANDSINAREAMLSHLTYVEALLHSHLQDSSNE
nr:FCD domain-containing protein [Oceanobacillus saliphilus]